MNRFAPNHLLGLLLLVVGLAACGGDSPDPALVDPDPEELQVDDNASTPSTASSGDDPGTGGTSPSPGDVATAKPNPGEAMIGSANMGGEIVDPKPHLIDDLAIAESYPEQLVLSFTAGDEPCLAATATALGSADQVRVVLEAGITTDALTRSCLAGQFPHSLTIALSEGLDGREVVIEQPESGDAAGEDTGEDTEEDAAPVDSETTEADPGEESDESSDQAMTPLDPADVAATLIGMGEEAAKATAESGGYGWRVMAIDGEEMIGTADYLEDRVNVKLVGGVVTEAWMG